MVEREAVVGPENGLHARPAKDVVQKARQFSSEIKIIKGEREANARSPIKVPALGAKKGETVLIRAEGEDAEAAVDALAEIISAED